MVIEHNEPAASDGKGGVMSDDPEYDDLVRHERRSARLLKKAHHRDQAIPCCYRCANAIHGYEGEINCGKTRSEKWAGRSVYPLQVCDLYVEPAARSSEEGQE